MSEKIPSYEVRLPWRSFGAMPVYKYREVEPKQVTDPGDEMIRSTEPKKDIIAEDLDLKRLLQEYLDKLSQ